MDSSYKETPWHFKDGQIVLCDRVNSCLSKIEDNRFSALIVKEKYKEVPSGLLGYLPWVGKDYYSFNTRLFVVGESYYKGEGNENPKHDEYGRALIAEWMCLEPNMDTYARLFSAIRPVIGDEKTHRESLCSSLVFLNLIQRCLMTPSGKEAQDFINGWGSFFKAVEILRPRLCVFIGVESKKYLQDGITEAKKTMGISIKTAEERVVKPGKIDNCWTHPLVRLEIDGGQSVTLLWLKHSSRSFAPEIWHKEFLMCSKEFNEWRTSSNR